MSGDALRNIILPEAGASQAGRTRLRPPVATARNCAVPRNRRRRVRTPARTALSGPHGDLREIAAAGLESIAGSAVTSSRDRHGQGTAPSPERGREAAPDGRGVCTKRIRGPTASSPEIILRKAAPRPTTVFDTYWKFATERQAIFHAQLVSTTRIQREEDQPCSQPGHRSWRHHLLRRLHHAQWTEEILDLVNFCRNTAIAWHRQAYCGDTALALGQVEAGLSAVTGELLRRLLHQPPHTSAGPVGGTEVVQVPSQWRDQAPHQGGRHLPQRRRHHPPSRRDPVRAKR